MADIQISFYIPSGSQTATNLQAMKNLAGYKDRVPNPEPDPPAGQEYIDNPDPLSDSITAYCIRELEYGVQREVKRILVKGNSFEATPTPADD